MSCAGRHIRRRRACRAALGRRWVTDGSAFLTVTSSAPLYSQASDLQLDRLHAVPGPAGRHVADSRDCADQPRHRHVASLPGCRSCLTVNCRDHVRTDVPADRQHRFAAKSLGAQRLIADSHVRRTGVDLPGRPPGRVRYHAHRHVGRHHACAVVLHRVRAVNGLRSVPGVADPRILAGIQPDSRRQRRKRGAWRWPTPAG